MFFVWMQGLRGPEPQIWAEEPVDGNGKSIKSALFKRKLSSDEEILSLNELAVKYEKDKLCGE